MREAGVHKPAIATTRCRTDFVCFNEHYIAIRITLFGQYCRPQSRVAATHDAQVARFSVHQHRVRLGLIRIVKPIRKGVGVRNRV